MTEELWQKLENGGPAAPHPHSTSSSQASAGAQQGSPSRVTPQFNSIHLQSWPEYDASLIESDDVTIVIQVNGKRRGEMEVQRSKIKDQKEIEGAAQEEIENYLEGMEIKKVIYIPGKIINFVI